MYQHNAPVTTIEQEAEDTSHEVSYVFTLRFINRGINVDQRRALGKLLRQRSMELSVFAELVAGPNMVKEVSLSRQSSQSGRSVIDFAKEARDDEDQA